MDIPANQRKKTQRGAGKSACSPKEAFLSWGCPAMKKADHRNPPLLIRRP
jgi:hypothetical protein